MRFPRAAWQIAAIVALLAAAVAGWLAFRAVQARHRLEAAQISAQQVQRALLAGDPATARRRLADVQRDVEAARASTDGPAWWLAAHLPYVGRSPRVIRGVVDALDRTAHDVLPELVQAGTAVNPADLHLAGAAVPLDGLIAGRAPLTAALTGIEAVQRELAALPSSGVLPAVARDRARVVRRIEALAATVRNVSAAANLAPTMLGADGPRHYLLALQNNAEARGTGGLVGVWGIITADHGRIRLSRVGSKEQLDAAGAAPVRYGAGYAALYGDDPGLWANANESPDFPYAAQLWLAMWHRYSALPLDGVIATDPGAMSYLLSATGPVWMHDGMRVSAENVVALVEREAYARFPVRSARKAWLGDLARAVFGVLGQHDLNAHAVLDALARGVREHRIYVFSAHPDEQRLLATTAVAGLLPTKKAPFVSVVVNNASGSKLDYFLHRRLDYTLGPCRAGMRRSTVTLDLGNDIPPGRLPHYVSVRYDSGGPAPTGSNRLLVYFFLTDGAGLRSATLDGSPISVVAGTERGHLVLEMPVELARGQTRRVVLNLQEPAYPGRPDVRVQPLVVPQVSQVNETDCADG